LVLNLERDLIVVIPAAVAVERNRRHVILAWRIVPPPNQHEEERQGRREGGPISRHLPLRPPLRLRGDGGTLRPHCGLRYRRAAQLVGVHLRIPAGHIGRLPRDWEGRPHGLIGRIGGDYRAGGGYAVPVFFSSDAFDAPSLRFVYWNEVAAG